MPVITTRRAVSIAGFAILTAYFVALLILLVTEWKNESVRQLVLDQFRVIVLLPGAGLFAIIVVSIFETTSGPIKFEVLGFKLEGAAGPIIMWVLCFLAIVLAISTFWQPLR
jgi:hypothetical protein